MSLNDESIEAMDSMSTHHNSEAMIMKISEFQESITRVLECVKPDDTHKEEKEIFGISDEDMGIRRSSTGEIEDLSGLDTSKSCSTRTAQVIAEMRLQFKVLFIFRFSLSLFFFCVSLLI